MHKSFTLVAALALAVGGLAFNGCDNQDDTVGTQGPAERTGEQIDRAGQQVQQGAERAGENLRQGAERTGERLQQGAERAGEATERAVERTGEAIENTVNPPATQPIDPTPPTTPQNQ